MARAVDQAWTRLGGIDMLVNNAGIGMRTVNPRFMTHPQGFWEVPAGGFRAVIETNLTGYFLVAREVTPRMLAAGGGRIVNISVSHSTMHRAGFVPYGPSRAGSEALSRIMAADLRDTGVTVNLLLPGGRDRHGDAARRRARGPGVPGALGDGPADRLAGFGDGGRRARRAHRRRRIRALAARPEWQTVRLNVATRAGITAGHHDRRRRRWRSRVGTEAQSRLAGRSPSGSTLVLTGRLRKIPPACAPSGDENIGAGS